MKNLTDEQKNELEAAAALMVKKYQRKHGASDAETALEALSIYESCSLEPPLWAINQIRKAWELYKNGRDEFNWDCNDHPGKERDFSARNYTLNEAFGVEKKNPRTREAERKEEFLIDSVYWEVRRLYESGMRFSSDDEIFLEASKKFMSGSENIKKLYKKALKLGYERFTGSQVKAK